MAKNDKRGRVTPKRGSEPSGRPPRRSMMPKRIGPFAKPDPSGPLGQVGRRPSSPTMLAVYAGVYIVCGVASFVFLSGSLGVVVGVVMIGVGLLWARGASTAYLRQRSPED
ncbi:MAG: hypothetical protein ACYDH6_01510 [Acidimicrobiales bacterium]